MTVKGVAPNQVSCNEFLNWININDLSCMPFTGSCYTWCNGRRGLHRIHRDWIELYVMECVWMNEILVLIKFLLKIVLIIPLFFLFLLVIF